MPVLQPSEFEGVLRLPDLSNNRALQDNLIYLTRCEFPAWHRGATIAVAAILSIYVVVGWGFCIWRVSRRAFWLIRWQGALLAMNSVNCFTAIEGVFLIIFIANTSAFLEGRYVPAVFLILSIHMWLGGWSAAWGVPLLYLVNVLPLGVVHQMKYSKAVARLDAEVQTLKLLPDIAPVTQAQLDSAVRVWAEFASAYSYSVPLYMSCAAWSLAAAVFVGVSLVRLLAEFRRQRQEHSSSSSGAGAPIDPVWSAIEPDCARSPLSQPKIQSVLQHEPSKEARFFPPYTPEPYTDPTDVLFRRVLHNMIATASLAMIAFSFSAGLCAFSAAYASIAYTSSDRHDFMLLKLTAQLYIGFSVCIFGVGAVYEVGAQSLQPVLGTWAHASTVLEQSVSVDSTIRPSAILRLNKITQSFFTRLRHPPKSNGSQAERTSLSFFETKSVNVQHRSPFVRPPDAPNMLDAFGMNPIRQYDKGSSINTSIDARSTDAKEAPLAQRPPSPVDALALRSHESETRTMATKGAYQLRVFPPPGHRTRIQFTHELRSTHGEPVQTRSPRPAPGQVKPDWRYPSGYLPRLQ